MNATPRRLLFAAVLGSIGLAPLAFAGDGETPGAAPGAPPCPPGAGRPAGEGRPAGGPGLRRRMGAMRGMRLLRAFGLSDEQRAAIRDARVAAEPIRKDTFEKIRGIARQAREAREAARAAGTTTTAEDLAKQREALRAQVKALLAAARDAVQPQAQRLVGSLTADQRAKAAERAAKHGKTLDDARLVKAFERILLAPERAGRGRFAGARGAK